ncbi:MAG TPA: hypothetical protein VF469_26895, partial [Kofleriaceae bacterium]
PVVDETRRQLRAQLIVDHAGHGPLLAQYGGVAEPCAAGSAWSRRARPVWRALRCASLVTWRVA